MLECVSRYFTDFRQNCAQNQKSPAVRLPSLGPRPLSPALLLKRKIGKRGKSFFQFFVLGAGKRVWDRDYSIVPSLREAIFEFGRGFYGKTYISVLSMLTLTPTVRLPMHD